jgi:hypothetical protein
VEVTLPRPDHLRSDGDWLARHAAGLIAFGLGLAAFIVVAVTQDQLWETPDPRISVPGLALAAIAAVASIARRERAYPLWLCGVGLAAAAVVLGWFLMLVVVIAATAALILLLHSVM